MSTVYEIEVVSHWTMFNEKQLAETIKNAIIKEDERNEVDVKVKVKN